MKSVKDRKAYIKNLDTGEPIVFFECEPDKNGCCIARSPLRRKEGGRAFYIRIDAGPEGSEYEREYINEEL